jgi:predicted SAM-dependent methyltransferase
VSVFDHLRAVAREARTEWRQRRTTLNGYDRLHLGGGPKTLDGWANIDLSGPVVWDLTRPLPMKGTMVRLVYSEHFIEHVTRAQALVILKNCFSVMERGATIRISTPDLKEFAARYLRGETVEMPHGNWFPETPCRMLNDTFHEWGHQFIYDEDELTALFRAAGFTNIRRMGWGKSEVPELRGLETRPDFGDLILEGDVADGTIRRWV